VHAIDEMASYITWCLTTLSGTSLDEVVDKKYDLESAYKQNGIRKFDRELLRWTQPIYKLGVCLRTVLAKGNKTKLDQ
jgi:hypothetical protein